MAATEHAVREEMWRENAGQKIIRRMVTLLLYQ